MMEKIKGSIMDTVENIFAQARQTGAQPVSFEIFPPKGELSMESAHTIAQELAKLDPAFISVTYSAGGSGNKQATAEIAAMIQDGPSALRRRVAAVHFGGNRRYEGPRHSQCACFARRSAGRL